MALEAPLVEGSDNRRRLPELGAPMAHTSWYTVPAELRCTFYFGLRHQTPARELPERDLISGIRKELEFVANRYLLDQLAQRGTRIEALDGKPGERYGCPCCGRLTLWKRGYHDLCRVCSWEDDGQDNWDADDVRGGPNGRLSLTQARVNTIRWGKTWRGVRRGVCFAQPANAFERERRFVLEPDRRRIREIGRDWESTAFV